MVCTLLPVVQWNWRRDVRYSSFQRDQRCCIISDCLLALVFMADSSPKTRSCSSSFSTGGYGKWFFGTRDVRVSTVPRFQCLKTLTWWSIVQYWFYYKWWFVGYPSWCVLVGVRRERSWSNRSDIPKNPHAKELSLESISSPALFGWRLPWATVAGKAGWVPRPMKDKWRHCPILILVANCGWRID